MYNLGIAFLVGMLVYTPIAFWMGPLYGIAPAVLSFGGVLFFLARWVGKSVEGELSGVVALLQDRKIEEARKLLEGVKAKWGPWQLLIAGQIDSQIGMIDYLQLKWDQALPKLEAGQWRNWMALVAIGCIHWRKGDREKLWEYFEKAASASPKEGATYMVWATLLHKADKPEAALKALDLGLKELPANGTLKDLQSAIANKRKVDTKSFPQAWYQFFPEDMAQQYKIKGPRTPPPAPPGAAAPAGPTNRKMRRSKT